MDIQGLLDQLLGIPMQIIEMLMGIPQQILGTFTGSL